MMQAIVVNSLRDDEFILNSLADKSENMLQIY